MIATIFIFAHPRIRQKAYSYFWMTHSLYIFLYITMFIHGLAKITGVSFLGFCLWIKILKTVLLQEPKFWIFFIVPGVIFILDKIVSLQTKYMELDILETDLLPSGKTSLFIFYWTFKYFFLLYRRNKSKVLPSTQLQVPFRSVGASLLHGLPFQRIPLPYANFRSARKLPLGARQGPGALDVETSQLLWPQQLYQPCARLVAAEDQVGRAFWGRKSGLV